MYQVTQITNDTVQQQSLALPDGTLIGLTLEYIPQQYGWFMQSLTYKTFVLNGTRVTVSPNILHQFRNQIPFGLMCIANVNLKREPTQQNDFSSGAFNLFILNATEVHQYYEFLNGK